MKTVKRMSGVSLVVQATFIHILHFTQALSCGWAGLCSGEVSQHCYHCVSEHTVYSDFLTSIPNMVEKH